MFSIDGKLLCTHLGRNEVTLFVVYASLLCSVPRLCTRVFTVVCLYCERWLVFARARVCSFWQAAPILFSFRLPVCDA